MKISAIAMLASMALFGAAPGAAGPLHDAAAASDLDGIRKLLGSGADVNARDAQGATPLHYAVHAGSAEGVNLLLGGGADLTLHYGRELTVLYVAMQRLDFARNTDERSGRERIVQLLQESAGKFPPPPVALAPAIASMTSALRQQMIGIAAGSFQMGDLTGKIPMESPHVESVRAFRISRYEVTFEQYDLYAQATGRKLPFDEGWGRGRRPVVNVSWDEAQAFIGWLNAQTGLRYRLPTEPEWEYAARAGTRTRYPWGDEFDMRLTNAVGDPGKRSGSGDTWPNAAPVGSFPPNAWGLHDMAGNVNEWTLDCHGTDQRGITTYVATGARSVCAIRVLRGGSFANTSASLRTSWRNSRNLSERMPDLGFRLALDAAD